VALETLFQEKETLVPEGEQVVVKPEGFDGATITFCGVHLNENWAA
jgi:hypothetical protein